VVTLHFLWWTIHLVFEILAKKRNTNTRTLFLFSINCCESIYLQKKHLTKFILKLRNGNK